MQLGVEAERLAACRRVVRGGRRIQTDIPSGPFFALLAAFSPQPMQVLPVVLIIHLHQFNGLSLLIIEPVSVRLLTSPSTLSRGWLHAREIAGPGPSCIKPSVLRASIARISPVESVTKLTVWM